MSDNFTHQQLDKFLKGELSLNQDENFFDMSAVIRHNIVKRMQSVPANSLREIYDKTDLRVRRALKKYAGHIAFDIMPDRFNTNWAKLVLNEYQPFVETRYHSNFSISFFTDIFKVVLIARHSCGLSNYNDKPHMNKMFSNFANKHGNTFWIEDFANLPLAKVRREKYMPYIEALFDHWNVSEILL